MKEDLNILFDKYLRDALSPEELQTLRQLVNASDDAALDAAMASHLLQDPLSHAGAESGREQAFRAITRHMDAVPATPVRRLWPRYAAAAAVLAGITASCWFLLRAPHTPGTVVQAPATPAKILPPANAGAWLTLANGSKVPLNGAAAASFRADSNAAWKKLQQGNLLNYAQAGAAGAPLTYNTLSTSRGMQFQVILPDGSHVWLNSASSLRYPTAFAKGNRTVELDGEAYFEIQPDPASPFHVQVHRETVDVLGTGFNIMGYADEPALRTTLFEGSVRVNAGNSVVLQPGQQAVAPENGVLSVQQANLDEVAAWRNGKFLFKRQNIQEIMRQVCRWYDVEVEYHGPVPDVTFSGDLSRTEEASQLLEILQETNNVHFQREGKKIIVTQ